MADQIAYYDMFFRKIPDGGGFAIMAGLEQVIEYLKNLHFSREDIAYLRSKKCFSETFLEYLANFHFECDVGYTGGYANLPGRAVADGTGGPLFRRNFGNYDFVNHQPSVFDCH